MAGGAIVQPAADPYADLLGFQEHVNTPTIIIGNEPKAKDSNPKITASKDFYTKEMKGVMANKGIGLFAPEDPTKQIGKKERGRIVRKGNDIVLVVSGHGWLHWFFDPHHPGNEDQHAQSFAGWIQAEEAAMGAQIRTIVLDGCYTAAELKGGGGNSPARRLSAHLGANYRVIGTVGTSQGRLVDVLDQDGQVSKDPYGESVLVFQNGHAIRGIAGSSYMPKGTFNTEKHPHYAGLFPDLDAVPDMVELASYSDASPANPL